MAKITNMDELRRLHDEARRRGPNSKQWLEFAVTMMDSFPAICETAKAMNAEMAWRRNAELAAEHKQTLAEAILKAGRDKVREQLLEDEIEAFDQAMAMADCGLYVTPNA